VVLRPAINPAGWPELFQGDKRRDGKRIRAVLCGDTFPADSGISGRGWRSQFPFPRAVVTSGNGNER